MKKIYLLVIVIFFISCGTKNVTVGNTNGDANTELNFCASGGTIDLNERYSLNYYLNLNLDSHKVTVKFKDAKVIDRQTNDTVNVEMENLKCALLSNRPIIYASVFEVTHIDQHYILHVLFDDRTIFNKKKVEFKATEKCYNVADLDPKRIEQYLGK
jgi:hypothetical protein